MTNAITLSPAQAQAINPRLHCLVEAGAGSGKTAILVQRYLNLIEQNPQWTLSEIVAITYTKKAAAEMLHRVSQKLIEKNHPKALQLDQARITTIHGFCGQLLRQFPIEAQVSARFKILDPLDSSLIWKTTLTEQFQDWITTKTSEFKHLLGLYTKKELAKLFDSVKNDHATITSWKMPFHQKNPDTAQDLAETTTQIFALYDQLYARFLTKKEKEEALDYDDILQKTYSLIKTHPDSLTRIKSEFKALMIDEFQDTDQDQWDFFKHILGWNDQVEHLEKNLLIVGDPKQSIYGFRGISSQLFQEVKTQFSTQLQQATVVQLSENFRTQHSLITELNPKFEAIFKDESSIDFIPLEAKRAPISTLPAITTHWYEEKSPKLAQEIDVLSNWITTLHTTHGFQLHDIGILIRRKKNMKAILDQLQNQNIPAQRYQAPRPKDHLSQILVNWVSALTTPTDTLSWVGILLSDEIGIHEDSLYLLLEHCDAQTLPEKLAQFTQLPPEIQASFDPKQTQKLQDLAKKLPQWISQTQSQPLGQILHEILTHFHYDETPVRQEFMQKLDQLDSTPLIDTPEILAHLTHWLDTPKTEANRPDALNHVQILSIHASKGLEFKAVAILECGAKWNLTRSETLLITEEGAALSHMVQKKQQNPLRDQLGKAQNTKLISEEKRLFYVACTRARDTLLLVGNQLVDSKDSESGPRSFVELWGLAPGT